jgi:hypothetical protein
MWVLTSLYEELSTLREGFQRVTSSNCIANEGFKACSEGMQSITGHLSNLGTCISEAANSLGTLTFP